MLRNNEQNLRQTMLRVCNIAQEERRDFKHTFKNFHNILSLIVGLPERSLSCTDVRLKVEEDLKFDTFTISELF